MSDEKRRKLRMPDGLDVIISLGVISTSVGAGMVALPAGFIVFGLLMMVIGLLAVNHGVPTNRPST